MTDSKLTSQLKRLRDLIAIISCASGLVIAVSYLGFFQSTELSFLDLWFRLRHLESREPRIVVITISESDLRKLKQWPIADSALYQAKEQARDRAVFGAKSI